MFSDEEIEALVLGSRWVAQRGDRALAAAARDAVAKVAAVLPPALRHELDATALLVGPSPAGSAADGVTDAVADTAPNDAVLAELRRAIRAELKLRLHYTDAQGRVSVRTIWPFALGFFDRVRVVVGWCETRGAFRHFRADRITGLQVLDLRYPRRRQAMLKEWRAIEGVPAP
jgi:predicted DNA-binding transcriptional regulator YafY